MQLFISIIGIITLLFIGLLFSSHRRAISLRTVLGAMMIQITFGAIILYSEAGKNILSALANGITGVMNYGNRGVEFLFGGLVSNNMFSLFPSNGFVFAFRILPLIIFFSSLVAMLYYLGIMQFIIRTLGGGLGKLLGTSKVESFSAAANIFVAVSEAPLVVKPYIANSTRSELFAIMCGGLASIAGSVMVGYAQMGVPLEYLIAAAFMSAPGGLLFAKIIIPETEVTAKEHEHITLEDGKASYANIIDAAASGAGTGLQLAVNVGAMLLAFIGIIALIDGTLGGISNWFNYPGLSLQKILGYFFSPFAFLIGVPWSDAITAGGLIGEKLVTNEFVAFNSFSHYLFSDHEVLAKGLVPLKEQSKIIISFALAGFANLGSIGILLGGIGVIAPQRRAEIASLGLRAVLAGTLSNMMSAAIAGFFLNI